jgi:hypothetical protein
MGWWQINSVECGGINWGHKAPTNSKMVNAVPGHETKDEMYNGDGPADIMGAALKKIDEEYRAAWERPAKKEELMAVFNFCLNGMFRGKEKEHDTGA